MQILAYAPLTGVNDIIMILLEGFRTKCQSKDPYVTGYQPKTRCKLIFGCKCENYKWPFISFAPLLIMLILPMKPSEDKKSRKYVKEYRNKIMSCNRKIFYC